MRSLPASLLLTSLVLGASSAALAQTTEPAAQTPRVIVTPDRSKPPAPKFRELVTPSEARTFMGTYALTNGETLKVERIGKQFFAETGSTGRMEIYAVAPYKFVDADRKLDFTFMPYGFPDEVKITGMQAR